MSKLRIKSMLHNEADILEAEDAELKEVITPAVEEITSDKINVTQAETIAKSAIQADKDIISKIVKEYDEDQGVTYLTFPIHIFPIKITLNTHDLYIKGSYLVNNNGENVYELSEVYFGEDDAYFAVEGDISEQVINGLSYILYDKACYSFDTYYLYYPKAILDYELDQDIVISDIATGLQCYYAHARVSNGKLNIVVAFYLPDNGTVLAKGTTTVGSIVVPASIYNKLYPYAGEFLSTKIGYLSSLSTQSLANGATGIRIRKASNNRIDIDAYQETVDNVTTVARDLRFEFNFLL